MVLPFVFEKSWSEDVDFLCKISFLNITLAIIFYTNTYLLIPKFLLTQRFWYFFITVVVMLILIDNLNAWVSFMIENAFHKHHHPRRYFFPIISYIMVLGVSAGIRITSEWLKNEKQKKEIENEKLATEVAFLKSQVHPHFLFNTLNNIYSLAYKKSDDAPAAILKLSQLMRYMLYESTAEKVFLTKEIEYLMNYIDLQKLRLAANIKIEVETKGDVENKIIAPMLLIPFVENAFKHGVSNVENSLISIRIEIVENSLHFEVRNPISRHKKTGKDDINGIGLSNVQRRLDLLYPENYKLEITDSDCEYKIYLQLNFES